jgi:hypothetical protein
MFVNISGHERQGHFNFCGTFKAQLNQSLSLAEHSKGDLVGAQSQFSFFFPALTNMSGSKYHPVF